MAAAQRSSSSDHSVSFDQLKELKEDLSGRILEIKDDWQRDNAKLEAGFHRFAAEIRGLVQGHAVDHKTDQVALEKRVSDLKTEVTTQAKELVDVRAEIRRYNGLFTALQAIIVSVIVWLMTGGKK